MQVLLRILCNSDVFDCSKSQWVSIKEPEVLYSAWVVSQLHKISIKDHDRELTSISANSFGEAVVESSKPEDEAVMDSW